MKKLFYLLFVFGFLSSLNASNGLFGDKTIQNTDFSLSPCDIIVKSDWSEISVKVLEVNIDNIKYKRCDNLDGPLITILKSEVLVIKYANGTKQVIEKSNSSSSSNMNHQYANESSSNNNSSNNDYKVWNTLSTVFSCISLFFSLFINWIIGLLFLIPALIFWAVGASMKNK